MSGLLYRGYSVESDWKRALAYLTDILLSFIVDSVSSAEIDFFQVVVNKFFLFARLLKLSPTSLDAILN